MTNIGQSVSRTQQMIIIEHLNNDKVKITWLKSSSSLSWSWGHPAPSHLIEMNGSLSGLTTSWPFESGVGPPKMLP